MDAIRILKTVTDDRIEELNQYKGRGSMRARRSSGMDQAWPERTDVERLN